MRSPALASSQSAITTSLARCKLPSHLPRPRAESRTYDGRQEQHQSLLHHGRPHDCKRGTMARSLQGNLLLYHETSPSQKPIQQATGASHPIDIAVATGRANRCVPSCPIVTVGLPTKDQKSCSVQVPKALGSNTLPPTRKLQHPRVVHATSQQNAGLKNDCADKKKQPRSWKGSQLRHEELADSAIHLTKERRAVIWKEVLTFSVRRQKPNL